MREDYQTLVDDVSASLGTPATLEDRDFTLIAFAAHEGDEERGPDADLDQVRTRTILQRRSTAAVRKWFESFGITRAREPVRIPPDPAAGVRTGRLCLPVRHGGVVYGYVWLLDDGALDLRDPRVARAQQTATRIGALLAAEAQQGAHAGALLRELLTGPAAGRAEAAEELRTTLGATLDGPLAVVAVAPWEPSDTAPDTGTLTSPGGGPAAWPGVAAHCLMPGAGGVRTGDVPSGTAGGSGAGATGAAEAGTAGGALAVLTRLRAAAVLAPARAVGRRLLGLPPSDDVGPAARPASPERSPGPSRRAAGIGAVRGEFAAAAPTAWREALVAARAAAAEPERFGSVAEWADIGPYRLLGRLPVGTAPDPSVRELLEPAHREMARTAEAFLDRAGQAGRTAADLGIHRQTLYYRLGRVERLTGLDLDDGADRLLLHVALKAARLS
ncbi:helix-turn-helix domain-containing protein [Streptomyces sp. DSM 42041]|uniref:Helix-turn-helix domain-containing protein n=1 Tax=Streptomyces hazeniae TaxID=3075538 RepID=A0ABU2NNX9_9ACTN|nr:helix-turn-helix domain-containing protein [Streptomyces sp. DSM 42041]MDT0378686.1 helix-turn-helix domain-containing protein [Streptomyces sp. DSM 42041]